MDLSKSAIKKKTRRHSRSRHGDSGSADESGAESSDARRSDHRPLPVRGASSRASPPSRSAERRGPRGTSASNAAVLQVPQPTMRYVEIPDADFLAKDIASINSACAAVKIALEVTANGEPAVASAADVATWTEWISNAPGITANKLNLWMKENGLPRGLTVKKEKVWKLLKFVAANQ